MHNYYSGPWFPSRTKDEGNFVQQSFSTMSFCYLLKCYTGPFHFSFPLTNIVQSHSLLMLQGLSLLALSFFFFCLCLSSVLSNSRPHKRAAAFHSFFSSCFRLIELMFTASDTLVLLWDKNKNTGQLQGFWTTAQSGRRMIVWSF